MGRSRIFVIVPAAGSGSRYGAGLPKQYALLDGRPLIAHTLERLRALNPAALVVALAPDDAGWETHMGGEPGVEIARCGGATRAATVRNALDTLASRCADDDYVAVHDAARACVPHDALQRLVAALADDPVGGLLALPVSDTLKRSAGDTPVRSAGTADRNGLWLAQTPQMFRAGLLRGALSAQGAADCTDEAEAIERAGHAPRLVTGSSRNIKVTYAADLPLAEAILASEKAPAAHG
jgi:2-C-methyl-D-erythritol 4-phosphate cytidylyltransferase